jgi:hypothetical protein
VSTASRRMLGDIISKKPNSSLESVKCTTLQSHSLSPAAVQGTLTDRNKLRVRWHDRDTPRVSTNRRRCDSKGWWSEISFSANAYWGVFAIGSARRLAIEVSQY